MARRTVIQVVNEMVVVIQVEMRRIAEKNKRNRGR